MTLEHKVQPLTTEQCARLLSSAVGTDWKAVVQWAAARFHDSGCVSCRAAVCALLRPLSNPLRRRRRGQPVTAPLNRAGVAAACARQA